jgi:hypothetical protein
MNIQSSSYWEEPVWGSAWIAKSYQTLETSNSHQSLELSKKMFCEIYYTKKPADCFSTTDEEWWNINYDQMWMEVFSYDEKQPAIMTLLGSMTNKQYFASKIGEWFQYLDGHDLFAASSPARTHGGLLAGMHIKHYFVIFFKRYFENFPHFYKKINRINFFKLSV